MMGNRNFLPGIEQEWPLAFVVDVRGFSHALFSKGGRESLCGTADRRRYREWNVVLRPWEKVDCKLCRDRYRAMMLGAVELLVGDDVDVFDWSVAGDTLDETPQCEAVARLCRRVAEILAAPVRMQSPGEVAAAQASQQRDAEFAEWLVGQTPAELKQLVIDRGPMYARAVRKNGLEDAIVRTWLRELFELLRPRTQSFPS